MTDFTPGTPLALSVLRDVRIAQQATWRVLAVDEVAINTINETAPDGDLVADVASLQVAIIATTNIAAAAQTMGYLNRAVINLGAA